MVLFKLRYRLGHPEPYYYYHYLEKSLLNQSILKIVNLILKTEALVVRPSFMDILNAGLAQVILLPTSNQTFFARFDPIKVCFNNKNK